MGFDTSQGQRALGPEWKEAMCQLAVPRMKKQLQRFLGMVEFCQIWIPNFGLMAKPLYEGTKGLENVLE